MNESPSCVSCAMKSQTCFRDLDEDSLTYLDDHKTAFFYKKGQIIFREGSRPHGIYCLNSGKIKIFKIGIDGREQIVRFVTPGGLLGIRALVGGNEYSAYAETLEDSKLCLINKMTFIKLIDENQGFAHCIMKVLCHLLGDAENKITSLALKPVRERLAETLLVMNNLFHSDPLSENGSKINLSRNDLANIIGTATETVIRLLSEFKDEDLISINGRSVTLLDIEGLKRTGKVVS